MQRCCSLATIFLGSSINYKVDQIKNEIKMYFLVLSSNLFRKGYRLCVQIIGTGGWIIDNKGNNFCTFLKNRAKYWKNNLRMNS